MGNMFWFITFLVFLFLELITVNLVTVWFATGALVSFVISLFIDNFFLEVFCFIIVSILMLITTKPMLKKLKDIVERLLIMNVLLVKRELF